MIVGFTITDFKGCEREAIEFIQRVCVLESPDIADNIISVGTGVNVYAKGLKLSDLLSQPFESLPIETQDDKLLIASAVNFNIELQYNGDIIRLSPTEYIYVDADEASQFEELVEQGLVCVYPSIGIKGKKWILENGSWDDNGVWDDSNNWRD